LVSNTATVWDFPLRDRNPQKFVPSIYKAGEEDFFPATQRIYCTPAMPSHMVLPVVGGMSGGAR